MGDTHICIALPPDLLTRPFYSEINLAEMFPNRSVAEPNCGLVENHNCTVDGSFIFVILAVFSLYREILLKMCIEYWPIQWHAEGFVNGRGYGRINLLTVSNRHHNTDEQLPICFSLN